MKFFEFFYSLGKVFYGNALFEHLKGYDSSIGGFNPEYWRFFGLLVGHVIAPALILFLLYYYIVNHPRLNRWWHWLIGLGAIALYSFVSGRGFVMGDIRNEAIDPDLAGQISSFNASMFGVYESLLAMLLFFLLTLTLRHWSANCKNSPWESLLSKSKSDVVSHEPSVIGDRPDYTPDVPEQRTLPKHLRTKVYGQTRTMVDMLIALNDKLRFTSADQALDALYDYLGRLKQYGDEVAFNCSWRSINAFAKNCFVNGELDVDKLEEACRNHSGDALENAYADYVAEKTVVIVSYMNEFRRYTNADDILEDFVKVTGGVSHCGSNPSSAYYFGFSDDVKHSFSEYVQNYWEEISTDGILDNAKFRDFMVGRHERDVEKYGLKNVIGRNYDFSCLPNSFIPKRGGAGPVYIPPYSGKYIKSCGNGTTGPDEFEVSLIEPLLREDRKYRKYNHWGESYYVPKEDYTLPLYFPFGDHWSRMYFDNEESKLDFIKRWIKDNG